MKDTAWELKRELAWYKFYWEKSKRTILLVTLQDLVFSCQFACVHIYMQWIFQITLVRVVTTMYGRCDFIFTFICYIFFVAVSSYFSSYCFVILLVLHLPNVVPFEWMRKTFIDYRQHFPLCYHLFVPIFVNIPIYITIIF